MALELSPAAQDYIKAVYALQGPEMRGQGTASTTAIAQRLDVSAASATNMLKKLDGMGLVEYQPYRGAALTESGRKIALEVVRHHRLLETYLAEALGVPWDQVHAEAEVLEHALSEELEERISAHLGHPTQDPHGHPIPAKDGTMPVTALPELRRLWDVDSGDSVAVNHVPDAEPDTLRYLAGAGIVPGARVDVVDRGPVGGPLFVKVDGADQPTALSKELAEALWVV
jgi:DtxR family transcriptional regulator, Mn-dependent transcriptional regulator